MFNILIGFFSALFVVTLGMGIWMYGNVVSLRHDITKLGENIQKEEVTGSELGNAMYNILNPQNLEQLAKDKGLVKDKNPEYMQISENQGITKI